MWIKPNGEMPFLYGNHVLKAHLGRITEDTPEHQGVVVYSMNDVPLVYCLFWDSIQSRFQFSFMQGFGVTSRSTVDTRKLDPTAIIVFHQAYVVADLLSSLSSGFHLLQGCWGVPSGRGNDHPATVSTNLVFEF